MSELHRPGPPGVGPDGVDRWAPPPLRSTDASRPGCRRVVGLALLVAAGVASLVVGAALAGALGSVTEGATRRIVIWAGFLVVPVGATVVMVRNRRRDPHAPDWKPFAAGAFTPIVVMGSLALLVLWATDWSQRAAFTPAAWAGRGTARVFLADDLVDRGILIGKTKAEVVAILGEPDNDWDTRTQGVSCKWHLGDQRQVLGYEILLVEFDADRRVRAVRIEARDF